MGPVVLSQAGSVPPLTAEILLVFAIVAVALVLFVLEPLPIDIVALAVLVSLIVLEPWTGVGAIAERYESSQYKQLFGS
jgi:di/tricarboxylate transporter